MTRPTVAAAGVYALTASAAGWRFKDLADAGQGEANPYINVFGNLALVTTSYDGGHGAESVFLIKP